MNNFSLLLQRLIEHKVQFIIIGGVAAVAHGSARLTQDVDLVYNRAKDNLSKIVLALESLNPYLRGAPPGLPFSFDESTLRQGLNFTLTTDAGAIDLLGEVAGGGKYEDLLQHSTTLNIFGAECLCVDLLMLIQLKRAAGRPKDLEVIAELERLLEEK